MRLRLSAVSAAVAFISELSSNTLAHVVTGMLADLLEHEANPASSFLWLNIVYPLVSLITGPMLIFAAAYFFHTCRDPRHEYKGFILMIFGGAYLGYIISATIWLAIALATGISQAAPDTTLESFYLPFWLPVQTLQSLSKSIHYIFVAFTASTLCHLRRSNERRKNSVEKEGNLR